MIEIKEHDVKLKGDLAEIIAVLKECLGGFGEDQKMVIESMSPGKAETRPGVVNKFFLRPIEKITGSALGAQGSSLSFERISVSVPAQKIYNQYRNFLNKMLKAGDKGANNASEEQIRSRVVLVCEVLKRLAAHAIAKDQVKYDGNEYIKLMRLFAQKVGQKDWFDHRMDFLELLNGIHEKWIMDLEKVVWFIKKLKNPEYTFQNLRIHLDSVREEKILPQLVAKLTKKKIKKANLESRWLYSELIKAENAILGREFDEFDDYVPLTDNELATIFKKYKESEDENGYLHTRYRMLKLNGIIVRMIESLDIVSGGTGWVVFFADAVNIPEIINMLKWYDDVCNKELHIDNAKEQFSKDVRLALVKMKALSCYGQSNVLLKGLAGLKELSNPSLKIALQQYLVSTVDSINPILHELLEAAPECPVTKQLVNGSAISAITGGKAKSNLLLLPKNPERSAPVIEEISDDSNAPFANNDFNDNNRPLLASTNEPKKAKRSSVRSSYAIVRNQMGNRGGVVVLKLLKLTKNELKVKPFFKKKVRELNKFLDDYTNVQMQVPKPKPRTSAALIQSGISRMQDIVGEVTVKKTRKLYRPWFKENIAHISAIFHALDDLAFDYGLTNSKTEAGKQFLVYKDVMKEVDRLYQKYFPDALIPVDVSDESSYESESKPNSERSIDDSDKGKKEEQEHGILFNTNIDLTEDQIESIEMSAITRDEESFSEKEDEEFADLTQNTRVQKKPCFPIKCK